GADWGAEAEPEAGAAGATDPLYAGRREPARVVGDRNGAGERPAEERRSDGRPALVAPVLEQPRRRDQAEGHEGPAARRLRDRPREALEARAVRLAEAEGGERAVAS